METSPKKKAKIDYKNEREFEVLNDHKPVPLNIAIEVMKAICKITIKTKKEIFYGTIFFINHPDSLKYLMTNYHVINPSLENEEIEIEIHNKKTMKLKFKKRCTKFIGGLKDIAMIEIKKKIKYINT